MQCPNCGKEAINVNGRYVCLDCGIELASDGTQAAPASTAPAVDNHATPIINDAMTTATPEPPVMPASPADDNPFGMAPAPTEPAPLAETPIAATPTVEPTPATPNPFAEPVSAETTTPDPSKIFAHPDPEQAVSPEDPKVEVVPDPAPFNPAPVLENQVTSSSEPAPAPAEPVKEYFMNALSQDSDAPASGMASTGGVLPDFPETPPADEPQKAATEPTPAPENYFQPASFDIAPGATEEGVATSEPSEPAPNPFSSPEPQPDASAEPAPLSVEPTLEPPVIMPTGPKETPEPVVPPMVEPGEVEIPINTTPVPAPEAPPTPSFVPDSPVVDPLDQVSPVDGMAQSEAAIPAVPPTGGEAGPSSFPGAGTIPSPESVFGTESNAPATPPVPAKKKSLKWLWIILAVLGVLIMFGGAYFGYSLYSQSKSPASPEAENTGQALTISQNVAGTMDESTDVAVSFTQGLDFSKATPKDASLSSFFSTPISLTESWAVDKTQNISFDATLGTVNSKRVYMKTENATYVYSNDTKTWVKTDGQQLSPNSIFFPVDPRGNLFYLGRVENFTDQGTETIDGVTAKKIKIELKEDTVKEMLTVANPAFAKIKYEEVGTDDLNVLAWVNDKNQIIKVTVSGTVDVTSDLYSGTVGVTANGTYKYATQTVAKPQ